MNTGRYNLSIQAGESFTKQFKIIGGNGIPFDLSGYTIQSYIKPDHTFQSSSAEFIASSPDPVNGIVNLLLPASASIALSGSCYFYDIRFEKDDIVLYPLEGKVTVSPSITRS
jgi:hypothetical protein